MVKNYCKSPKNTRGREFSELGILFVVYIAVYTMTGYGIPCFFHKITGYKCPGCGMSHALASLVHGDILSAVRYNILSVTILPTLSAYIVLKSIVTRDGKEERFRWYEIIFLLVCLVCCIVFFLIRNDFV